MANDVALVRAVGTLTATGNFTSNDTVVVGAKTYKFEASPGAENDVDLGADLEESLDFLARAINGTFAVGEAHADTEANDEFTATNTTTTLVVTARVAGVQGNALAFSEGVDGGTVFSVGALASGAGDMEAFLQSLVALNQLNSEVILELNQVLLVNV